MAEKKGEKKPAAARQGSRRAQPSAAAVGPRDVVGDATPASAGTSAGKAGVDVAGSPIVGIGASAGGLDAFKKFFSAMPPDSKIAFVLIPHLDPTHASLMVELLSRHTAIPVSEAQEGMPVVADHVYIIPPNKYMTISGGALRLTGPVERRGIQTSIDLFLRSLAEDQHEKAISIILSGTGAHGASGMRAVKAAGGMTMVQDPRTAEYDRMPSSAIATGLANYILPVEQMPEALIKYVRHYYINGKTAGEEADPADHLNQVLALLRGRTRFDFRGYRKKMLARRLERRMGLNHCDKFDQYLAFLREHPDEIQRLTQDLLISVTGFFREPESYKVIEEEVLAPLVHAKHADGTLRVWVPGCATGEEPYSLGMLLLEQLALARQSCRLQIFATDIDESGLEVARAGIYGTSIVADLASERLDRFFTRVDETGYQVKKQLRECVTFANQNLISDPPFSKMDLVSCRNLLIYLEPEVQNRVVPLLHFALNDAGCLFLGSSETIGRHSDLFEPISKKCRIYKKIGHSRLDRVELPPTARVLQSGRSRRPTELAEPRPGRIADLAQRALLEEFAPAAVLVTRKYQILYFFGPTTLYLDVPTGEATHDLLAMAREGLCGKLRIALDKAIRDGQPVTVGEAQVKRGDTHHPVNVTVKPLPGLGAAEELLLVTFQDDANTATESSAPKAADDQPVVWQLEYELRATREDLQSTILELETSNEELKGSNEEVMSMNEELQSANEEMESSKEELQSLNEELTTVNNQLQDKVGELERTNDDLANLLNATDVASLFLDTDFRIKRFTPAATKMFNVIATDIGRPLANITPKFNDPDMRPHAEQVLRELSPRDTEVQTKDGRWYIRRILPYRTLDNRIDGVVLTFSEVTQLKLANDRSRLLATVMLDSNDAIMIHNFDGRIMSWNRGAERLYGYTEAEAVGMQADLTIPAELRTELRSVWERLRQGERIGPYEAQRLTKDGRVIDVWVTATVVTEGNDNPVALAKTERDITKQKKDRAELEREVERRTTALREQQERLRSILNAPDDAIITIDHQGIIESVNPAAERMFGYAAAEMVGANVRMLMPALYGGEHAGSLTPHASTGEELIVGIAREVMARRKDGSLFPVDLSISEVEHLNLFTGIIRDITLRRNLEKEVQEIAIQEQRRIGTDLHDHVGQELTALALMVDSLLESINERSPAEVGVIRKVNQGLKRLLGQVRVISRGLVPVEVDAHGLTAALAELAATMLENPGVRCTFRCDMPIEVKDNMTAQHLLLIAREACTNSLKHGHAKNIEIQLDEQRDRLILEVADDGVGLPAEHKDGLGMRIMRNRARLIEASLSLEPIQPHGTLMTCTVIKDRSHEGERGQEKPGDGSDRR